MVCDEGYWQPYHAIHPPKKQETRNDPTQRDAERGADAIGAFRHFPLLRWRIVYLVRCEAVVW